MKSYRFTGYYARIIKDFASDEAAFEYCHGMTDDDSAHVEKLVGGVWCEWNPVAEAWVELN